MTCPVVPNCVLISSARVSDPTQCGALLRLPPLSNSSSHTHRCPPPAQPSKDFSPVSQVFTRHDPNPSIPVAGLSHNNSGGPSHLGLVSGSVAFLPFMCDLIQVLCPWDCLTLEWRSERAGSSLTSSSPMDSISGFACASSRSRVLSNPAHSHSSWRLACTPRKPIFLGYLRYNLSRHEWAMCPDLWAFVNFLSALLRYLLSFPPLWCHTGGVCELTAFCFRIGLLL